MSDARSGGAVAVDFGTGGDLGAAWLGVDQAAHGPGQKAEALWTAYSPVDGSVLLAARTDRGAYARC